MNSRKMKLATVQSSNNTVKCCFQDLLADIEKQWVSRIQSNFAFSTQLKSTDGSVLAVVLVFVRYFFQNKAPSAKLSVQITRNKM